MPSPIGHSIMGYTLYRAFAPELPRRQWSVLGLCLFAANAADLDFLPGLLVGELGRFHHGPSHSLLAALLFGMLAAMVFPLQRAFGFTLGFLNYLSHVVLDFLIDDPSWPYGVPLFWPFSAEYHMSPVRVFHQFDYAAADGSLFVTLLSIDNFLAITNEIVVLLPFLAVVYWLKHKASKRFVDSKNGREAIDEV